MKNWRFLVLVPLMFVVGCSSGGCYGGGQEVKDRELVNEQQAHYGVAQPIPRFDFSIERDAAIQIYEGRNENVTTWTVWRSNSGVIEGHCESIGFPLPYDVQLTNPTRTAWDANRNKGEVIEQAEPNGLFSSKNTAATWVRAVTKKGGKRIVSPIYIESKVTCYPYPVVVDYEKNTVRPVEGAEPNLRIKQR